jgi:hypothetical protein
MTSAQLALFFMRQPFQPITLFVADGRAFAIRQPDFVAVGRAGLGVWVLDPSGEIEIIDAALICSIRTIGPADLDEFTRE